MKIVIDARFYGTEHTGLGRYTINFLQALTQLPAAQQHQFNLLVRRRYLDLEFPSNFHLVEAEIVHYSLAEQIQLPRIINQLKPDLFHALHFNVPYFYSQPFLVTVHDLIKSHFDSKATTTRSSLVFRAKRWGYQQVIHHALYQSVNVIVPSQTVKQDILRFYPDLNSHKIKPIYEAPDPTFLQSPTINSELSTINYLLYVGNAYPHKNLITLLDAFYLLTSKFNLKDIHSLKLVLVTKKTPFLEKTLNQFFDLRGRSLKDRLVILSNLSDQELVSVYQQARLTAIPSLMEGFSLTGLESLSVKTPVVVSDIPIHREIYGSAAAYADPHSAESFAQTIASNLTKPHQGKLPRQYSWHQLAKSILSLYENYEKNRSRL